MGQFIDETGNRYGSLYVLKRSPNISTRVMWECKCDCGKVVITQGTSLRSGNSTTCGCRNDNYERFSDEELLVGLRLYFGDHGCNPKEKEWPSASTIVRRFGNWNKALAAADLSPSMRGPRVTDPSRLARNVTVKRHMTDGLSEKAIRGIHES